MAHQTHSLTDLFKLLHSLINVLQILRLFHVKKIFVTPGSERARPKI